MLRISPFRPLAALAVLITALTLAGCGVNNIPTYEQSAKAKWSEVLNQYKRRADLIPNLVETVKGFAEQEKNVLTGVTRRAPRRASAVQIPADILTNPEAMKKFQDAQNTLGRRAAPAAGRGRALSRHQVGRRTSSPCSSSSKAPRTASPSRGATTSRRCASITPRSPRSLAASGSRHVPAAKEMATFDIPAEEMKTPKVDFGTKK